MSNIGKKIYEYHYEGVVGKLTASGFEEWPQSLLEKAGYVGFRFIEEDGETHRYAAMEMTIVGVSPESWAYTVIKNRPDSVCKLMTGNDGYTHSKISLTEIYHRWRFSLDEAWELYQSKAKAMRGFSEGHQVDFPSALMEATQ